MGACHGVVALRVEESVNDDREVALETDIARSSRCRHSIAMISYLALDRQDIASTAVPLARRMARPRSGDEVGLRRCIRYPRAHPTVAIGYPTQYDVHEAWMMTDAGWVTFKWTRNFISGDVLVGDHHAVRGRVQCVCGGVDRTGGFPFLRQEACGSEEWRREGALSRYRLHGGQKGFSI